MFFRKKKKENGKGVGGERKEESWPLFGPNAPRTPRIPSSRFFQISNAVRASSVIISARRRMAGSASCATTLTAAVRGPSRLKRFYKRTQQLILKIPRDAAYRKNMEVILCHRLQLLNDAGDDIKELEECLGGKMEMLIYQADLEFQLVTKMLTWKPWERLTAMPPAGQWDWPPAAM